jgi:hypothetical protein
MGVRPAKGMHQNPSAPSTRCMADAYIFPGARHDATGEVATSCCVHVARTVNKLCVGERKGFALSWPIMWKRLLAEFVPSQHRMS